MLILLELLKMCWWPLWSRRKFWFYSWAFIQYPRPQCR